MMISTKPERKFSPLMSKTGFSIDNLIDLRISSICDAERSKSSVLELGGRLYSDYSLKACHGNPGTRQNEFKVDL